MDENDCEILPTDDNDDPLVAEVDVYLTRIFADQLYLFQYPLRSSDLQYENQSTFLAARIKPKNKLVQLDYTLDTQSDFHCQDKEKQVVDNWTTSNDTIRAMDRLTLSSSNLTLGEDYKRFTVGIFTSNGLQLSPLNAIFQLRPDFDATSTILAQQQNTSIDDDELENDRHSSTEESTTTDDESNANELVTMKFWRPESRLQQEKKVRSYNYFERARNEERWIDFAYFSPNESPAIELRNQWMMRDHLERNRFPIRWRKTVSIAEYFQLLFFDRALPVENIVEKEKLPIEMNVSTEQKPLVVPPTKPKKKKKNESEKSTKKTSRKSRRLTQESTESPSNIEQNQATTSTPLSSVILPKTIIKQDPETIQNELLSFMKRRFGYRPYFKLSEINIAIKLELISSPPGHPLATGVTEASILRAAAEIGSIYVNKKWPKNLKQEPVFINGQMGDKYDVLRRYVAELLEKCDSFQFTELRSRIKQENQTQQFPVHEVKKFVKDHCITRSSRKGVLYCVKGTAVR